MSVSRFHGDSLESRILLATILVGFLIKKRENLYFTYSPSSEKPTKVKPITAEYAFRDLTPVYTATQNSPHAKRQGMSPDRYGHTREHLL